MLAKTLLDLAQNGPDAFYKGRLGRLVLAELQKMGSNITFADLNEYRYWNKSFSHWKSLKVFYRIFNSLITLLSICENPWRLIFPIWFSVKWTDTHVGTLSTGYTIYSAPPPGSGAIVTSILRIFERFNHNSSNIRDAAPYLHLLEAFKFSYAQRTKLGDIFGNQFANETIQVKVILPRANIILQ